MKKLKNSKNIKKKKEHSFRTFVLSFRLLFIVLTSLFLLINYSSIFWKMQETSFFTFSMKELRLIVGVPIDWADYVFRLLLHFCCFPWISVFLITLFLVLIQWLSELIICFRPSLKLLLVSYLPSFATLYAIHMIGYQFLSYRTGVAPTRLFLIPFLVLLTVTIVWLCLLLYRKYYIKRNVCDGAYLQQNIYLTLAGGFLFFAMLFAFCLPATNLKKMTQIQRCMDKQDWHGVIELSKGIEYTNRAIAAYRAIALLQTNQLENHLFDIPYDYVEIPMTKKEDGTVLADIFFYLIDADFYSGLINRSINHLLLSKSMQGTSVFTLKKLVRCALLNGEWNLAERYLFDLEHAPFQTSFVEKYRSYLKNHSLMQKDAELVSIADLMPAYDHFDKKKRPVFLDYYTTLLRGRSRRSLMLSLSALLYTKNLDGFRIRLNTLKGEALPKHFQEAVVLDALTLNPGIEKQFSISPSAMKRGEELMAQLGKYSKELDKGKQVLREKYGDHYIYYYVFGNDQSVRNASVDINEMEGGAN